MGGRRRPDKSCSSFPSPCLRWQVTFPWVSWEWSLSTLCVPWAAPHGMTPDGQEGTPAGGAEGLERWGLREPGLLLVACTQFFVPRLPGVSDVPSSLRKTAATEGRREHLGHEAP